MCAALHPSVLHLLSHSSWTEDTRSCIFSESARRQSRENREPLVEVLDQQIEQKFEEFDRLVVDGKKLFDADHHLNKMVCLKHPFIYFFYFHTVCKQFTESKNEQVILFSFSAADWREDGGTEEHAGMDPGPLESSEKSAVDQEESRRSPGRCHLLRGKFIND